MINHILLELFCIKGIESKDNTDCVLNVPTYECLVKGCKFCSFTSHENALCYVNNEGNSKDIISLGNEMIPDFVDKSKAEKLWEQISIEALEEAYDKYMNEICKQG